MCVEGRRKILIEIIKNKGIRAYHYKKNDMTERKTAIGEKMEKRTT